MKFLKTWLPVAIFSCTATTTLMATELEFRVDLASQVNGGDVFKQVENFWHHKEKWRGAPEGFEPTPEWLRERTEGVIRVMSGDYGIAQAKQIYSKTDDGSYRFKAPPGFDEKLDLWANQPDVGIWMNMGTNAIPAPLIEGGYKTDTYGYNVRQPNDYAAYYEWLISFFEYVVDRYGREEVSRWVFQFGFEADWQTKFLKPGTGELMDKRENRREFLKLLDYFQAAAEEVIGPDAAVACYFALITQADDYIRHWAVGENFKTGKVGTNMAFVGFSDWYHIGPKPAGKWYDPDTFKMSPFTADQTGDGKAHGNAYVGGMQFKYNYMLNLLARYPQVEDLQFYLPESGYIQIGSKHPAPLTFADHYGASLYALRTMAFSHFPKIIQVGNNFALSTGDRGAWYHDAAKPPVFHIQRIQQRLAGERKLLVTPDRQSEAATEIRAVASAADPAADLQRVRFLTTNFNFLFHKIEAPDPANTHQIRVVLESIPDGVKTVKLTPYRIDLNHNNWWPGYINWREQVGLEFATSGYGVWAKYDIKYAPHVNDPLGTLRPKDRDAWIRKSAEIAGNDDLRPSAESIEIAVTDGTAEYAFELAESATLYFEAEFETAGLDGDYNLDFAEGIDTRWTSTGKVELQQDADSPPTITLSSGPQGTELRQLIRDLPPLSSVTFSAEVRTGGRNVNGGIFAETPVDVNPVDSFAPRTAQWERVVVTTRSDDVGRIVIGMQMPGQQGDGNAKVEFRNLGLRLNSSPSRSPIKTHENVGWKTEN